MKTPLTIMLALALSTCVSLAGAKDLQFTASDADDMRVFIDYDSIAKVGPKLKAWVLYNFPTSKQTTQYQPKDYRSVLELTHYDCAERTSGAVQSVAYAGEMGSGQVMSEWDKPPHFTEVVPGSVGETVLMRVCTHTRGKK
jgi:hypothetical protein